MSVLQTEPGQTHQIKRAEVQPLKNRIMIDIERYTNDCQQMVDNELTPSNIYSADLEAGYHIEAVCCLADPELNVITKVKYNLSKNGKLVFTFSADQANESDKTPEMIMPILKQYLIDAEGEAAAAWIEESYLKHPENLPPWERKQPVRDFKIKNESAVIIELQLKNLIDEFTLNDSGNAARFAKECLGWLVYDKSSSEWFAWVNNHWEPADEKLQKAELFVSNSLKGDLEYFKELAVKYASNDSIDKLLKKYIADLSRHIDASLNISRLEAMSKLARADLSIDLDKESNIQLIAFMNGIVDTSTGKIYEIYECAALKEQYPVIYIDREYRPDSKPKLFNEHLRLLFTDNTSENIAGTERTKRAIDTDEYIRRFLGYLLVSGNPEQIMTFWYGSGSNGKSTTINLLRYILGDQVAEASCTELYTSREEKPASGISQGLGCRALLFSEMSSSNDWNTRCNIYNTDSVKTLTGDSSTSRFRELYQKSKTKRIVCKPLALTNSFPEFNSIDDGLLRRIITIPFPHKFESTDRDKNMEEKLRSEADEIFSLMLDELKKYREIGFPELPDYCQETKKLLLSGGIYSEFAQSEFCSSTDKGESNKMKGSAIQARFLAWCEKNEIDVKRKVVKRRDDIIDNYGYRCDGVISDIALADGEVRKLYKAFKVQYGSVQIHGIEYFNCKPISH